VDQIAEKLMQETAVLLSERLRGVLKTEELAKADPSPAELQTA